MKNISNSIKSLFSYTCNIFEFNPIIDPITKKSYLQKVLVHQNIPCRISYTNSSSSNYITKTNFNNISLQYIKLFLHNHINVKPGSTIIVFKDSYQIATFQNSSVPKVYSNHQEIYFSIKDDFL